MEEVFRLLSSRKVDDGILKELWSMVASQIEDFNNRFALPAPLHSPAACPTPSTSGSSPMRMISSVVAEGIASDDARKAINNKQKEFVEKVIAATTKEETNSPEKSMAFTLSPTMSPKNKYSKAIEQTVLDSSLVAAPPPPPATNQSRYKTPLSKNQNNAINRTRNSRRPHVSRTLERDEAMSLISSVSQSRHNERLQYKQKKALAASHGNINGSGNVSSRRKDRMAGIDPEGKENMVEAARPAMTVASPKGGAAAEDAASASVLFSGFVSSAFKFAF